MISITLAAMLAAAAPAAGPPAQPRRAYGACLTKFGKAKAGEKLTPESFVAAAKAACAVEESAFKKSLIDYDVRTGTKRGDAEEGAQLQVEDYLANAADTYQVNNEPAPPK
jgi:hypothetical protein